MPEFDLSQALAAIATLLALAGWAVAAGVRRRLVDVRAETRQLQERFARELELVRQSISGLTAGTVGMDRRMKRLETRERALSERQETYENQQADDQPYGQAIRLVQQGAAVGRLVDELGLSESEAELIVRLHGERDTA